MRKVNSIGVLLYFYSLLLLGLNDQTVAKSFPKIKVGLWEMEQIIEMPSGPRGGGKQKWQYCVTHEEAQKGIAYIQQATENQCQVENLQYPARNRVTYDVVCQGDPPTRMKVDYKYTSTTFEGTSQLVLPEEINVTGKIKGRYLGACKK